MEETQTSSKDRLKPIMTSFGFVLIEKNIEATKVLKVIPAWWFDSQTCLGKADPQPGRLWKAETTTRFFSFFRSVADGKNLFIFQHETEFYEAPKMLIY